MLQFHLSIAASLLALLFTAATVAGQESEKSEKLDYTIEFSPPHGWHMAESKDLPPNVKMMVIGKTDGHFPPSINLATEAYSGTLKEYLKIVQNINNAKGAIWKDLGTIQTAAGVGSLSQVDAKVQWGDISMLHLILLHKGTVYILTAAAAKAEFSNFYQTFFNSLRSLRINN